MGQYDVLNRNCGNGSETAYSTFNGALTDTRPGDEVELRQGDYSQLDIDISGNANAPITIRATDGELVVVSGNKVGLNIINQANLIITGIVFEDLIGHGRIESSQDILVTNNRFLDAYASGTVGALKILKSNFIRVIGNEFNGGSDLLILQDNSRQNIIEDNTFINAGHALLAIRCASENVVRGNTFYNEDQKSAEIYDCEGVSDAPFRLNDTKRNLLELNLFTKTRATGDHWRYNAIQHGGQQTIVRRNQFYDNDGGGVHYQYYSDESLYVWGNRLYNNTFARNKCFATEVRKYIANRYYDLKSINNAYLENSNCNGTGQENSLASHATFEYRGDLAGLTSAAFVDEANNDFRPATGGGLIDTGEYLTSTTSAGSGSNLPVEDATFFYDGFGIPGEVGDLIRLSDSNESARIVSIDLATNILHLDRTIQWTQGQGVSQMYGGSGPDVGAIESMIIPKPPVLIDP